MPQKPEQDASCVLVLLDQFMAIWLAGLLPLPALHTEYLLRGSLVYIGVPQALEFDLLSYSAVLDHRFLPFHGHFMSVMGIFTSLVGITGELPVNDLSMHAECLCDNFFTDLLAELN